MRHPALALLFLASCATPSASAPREILPARVHVIETYETDIEKRWWLAGKLETENVPPGSTRACRGTESKDFDDKMGDPKARYTAVIFNPVPGPPMGPATRLRFRYWLRGTDRLRVQIFSLSNNYHRRLELSGLPQRSWQEGRVDMTQLRRPDGSGGPLSEDERIDDIQFYVDRAAELIIDDIVLYDAAGEYEREPFPARLIFTAWFDTGKQGQEWPGDFEIVPHEKPEKWKAAKSAHGLIRVSLRGLRPVDAEQIHAKFRCRLTGTDRFTINLEGAAFQGGAATVMPFSDQWKEVRIPVRTGFAAADAIVFTVSEPGLLLIDDLLLYEP